MRFKQYLMESTTVLPDYVIELTTNQNLSSQQFEPIKRKIVKMDYIQAANLNRENLEFTFAKLPQHEASTSALENRYDQVKQIVDDHLEDLSVASRVGEVLIDIGFTWLKFDDGIPPFPVSSDMYININIGENTSLQGLDKVISYTRVLVLKGCDRLKPSPVLGLFKCKGVANFELEPWDKPGWWGIVDTYLKDGPDMTQMLECKEELMNAGYKEYAKL